MSSKLSLLDSNSRVFERIVCSITRHTFSSLEHTCCFTCFSKTYQKCVFWTSPIKRSFLVLLFKLKILNTKVSSWNAILQDIKDVSSLAQHFFMLHSAKKCFPIYISFFVSKFGAQIANLGVYVLERLRCQNLKIASFFL